MLKLNKTPDIGNEHMNARMDLRLRNLRDRGAQPAQYKARNVRNPLRNARYQRAVLNVTTKNISGFG